VTPRRTHEIVVACVLAGAVFWMYGGIVSSLARQWASDDNYSHDKRKIKEDLTYQK